MDLTVRVEYWIKFCMKLTAVISSSNYTDPNIENHTDINIFLK
jgi:hypothetical protein